MKFWATPYHYNLLKDQERLSAFYEAIKTKSRGVVFDLGSGSGIMSCFAAPYSDFIYSIEIHTRSAAYAAENLKGWKNIEVINSDVNGFNFTCKADVIICEMLDTALIDEEQVPVLNHALKYLNSGGVVIPAGVLNGAELVSMKNPGLVYEDQVKVDYTVLGSMVIYDSLFFKEKIIEEVEEDIVFHLKKSGKINALKLTTFTLLSEDLICGPTPMLNPPLFIPLDELYANKGDKVTVNLAYTMGGGLDSIQTKIKNIS
ncbi:MAG: RNA methyltransferase [Methanobacterium sp.]|nr:MAG: RNA methyltransferase [Methanobacterium sp.]